MFKIRSKIYKQALIQFFLQYYRLETKASCLAYNLLNGNLNY